MKDSGSSITNLLRSWLCPLQRYFSQRARFICTRTAGGSPLGKLWGSCVRSWPITEEQIKPLLISYPGWKVSSSLPGFSVRHATSHAISLDSKEVRFGFLVTGFRYGVHLRRTTPVDGTRLHRTRSPHDLLTSVCVMPPSTLESTLNWSHLKPSPSLGLWQAIQSKGLTSPMNLPRFVWSTFSRGLIQFL